MTMALCVWVRDLEPTFGEEPEFGRISQLPGLAPQKGKFPIFMWDLLLGFVTPKSRLKIPSKHIKF
jgi:hypothetical protein